MKLATFILVAALSAYSLAAPALNDELAESTALLSSPLLSIIPSSLLPFH